MIDHHNHQANLKRLSIRTDLYPVLAIAIPLILTGALQSSLGFFENMFLAHLGQKALAAGALVSWLFYTMISLLFGIFSAANVLIAHQYGAKDEAGISAVLRDAVILALMIFPFAFLLFWHAADIFLLFGQKPELIELARLYLHALAWGLIPKFTIILAFELLTGLGHSRLLMMITLASIPFYIFFSYVLIFGKFGFPMLAIAGAGWGMTLADWLIATAVCTYLWYKQPYRQYLHAMFAASRKTVLQLPYIRKILHIGLPMGGMYCVETGYFFMMSIAMGWISVYTLAANQIAIQYLGFLTSLVFAAAQAITVRMGHLLGAGETLAAKRAAQAGLLFSLAFMMLIAQLYWFFPGLLIGIDLNIHHPRNAETVRLATAFLFSAAFFQIFEAIRLSLFGALRGLKDTKFTLISSVICFWCIALPLGYLFAIRLNFGGQAFWWAMVAGAICSVVLLYARFNTMMHRQLQVVPEK